MAVKRHSSSLWSILLSQFGGFKGNPVAQRHDIYDGLNSSVSVISAYPPTALDAISAYATGDELGLDGKPPQLSAKQMWLKETSALANST